MELPSSWEEGQTGGKQTEAQQGLKALAGGRERTESTGAAILDWGQGAEERISEQRPEGNETAKWGSSGTGHPRWRKQSTQRF